MGLQKLGENAESRIDGLAELLFLAANHGGDVLLFFLQFRILAAADFDNGIDDLMEERLVHTEELAVTRSPAQQTAQHIAASFIRREYTVADHKDGTADMIRDHAQ